MSKVLDLQDEIRKHVDDVMNNLGAYQELLAGAFAQVTNLDPRDCQIIHQTMRDGTVRIWYEARRQQDKEDRIAALNEENDMLRAEIKMLRAKMEVQ